MERGFATVCTLSQKRHMGCRLEYWTLGRAELIRTRINLELQEPCAVKVACTVRKGGSGGNPANLLGKYECRPASKRKEATITAMVTGITAMDASMM